MLQMTRVSRFNTTIPLLPFRMDEKMRKLRENPFMGLYKRKLVTALQRLFLLCYCYSTMNSLNPEFKTEASSILHN